jgi:hypothetical protein
MSGVSYLFNATPDDQQGAEAACNAYGGHLAIWGSLSEQQEVERALVVDGGLIGSYHQSYWLGLAQSESNAQQFLWLDRTVPAPSNRTYQHWQPGQPNSKTETCAVASWKASYSGAWGWDDADCYNLRQVYICKKSRECGLTNFPISSCNCCCWRPDWHRSMRSPLTTLLHNPPSRRSAQDGPLPQHHDQQRLPDQHHPCHLLHTRGSVHSAGRSPGQLHQRAGAGGVWPEVVWRWCLAACLPCPGVVTLPASDPCRSSALTSWPLQEVEGMYISQGVLLPAYHQRYWVGLYIPYRDPKLWPGAQQRSAFQPVTLAAMAGAAGAQARAGCHGCRAMHAPLSPSAPYPAAEFLWLDGSTPPSSHGKPMETYGHWGVWYEPDGTERAEPNNAMPPEFCAVANYTQLYERAWGWSDQNCEDEYIAMCKFPAPPPPAPKPPPPAPPPPAPPLDPYYLSPTTGTTFYFEGRPTVYRQAQLNCEALAPGGRLVVFMSAGMQREIEAAYTKSGWLLNGFVPFYWIGLYVPFYNTWPDFIWSNGVAARDHTYQHWGGGGGWRHCCFAGPVPQLCTAPALASSCCVPASTLSTAGSIHPPSTRAASCPQLHFMPPPPCRRHLLPRQPRGAKQRLPGRALRRCQPHGGLRGHLRLGRHAVHDALPLRLRAAAQEGPTAQPRPSWQQLLLCQRQPRERNHGVSVLAQHRALHPVAGDELLPGLRRHPGAVRHPGGAGGDREGLCAAGGPAQGAAAHLLDWLQGNPVAQVQAHGQDQLHLHPLGHPQATEQAGAQPVHRGRDVRRGQRNAAVRSRLGLGRH